MFCFKVDYGSQFGMLVSQSKWYLKENLDEEQQNIYYIMSNILYGASREYKKIEQQLQVATQFWDL